MEEMKHSIPEDCSDYILNIRIPFRKRFCAAWLTGVLHLRHITTSGCLGAHASLKRKLGSSRNSLLSFYLVINQLCVWQQENIFMKLVKDLIYLSSECPPIFGDLVKKISIVALRVSNKEYKLATVCLDKDGQDPNHRHEQCDKILCWIWDCLDNTSFTTCSRKKARMRVSILFLFILTEFWIKRFGLMTTRTSIAL